MLEMMPHQEAGFTRYKDSDTMALFWQMRVGKTLPSTRWVLHRLSIPSRKHWLKQILVVTYSTPIIGWKDTLLAEEQKHKHLTVKDSTIDGTGFFLISYQLLMRRENLLNHPWSAVILDESLAIMNPKAQTTKNCIGYFKDIPVRAILTGEPAPESREQYFCQMAYLFGGEWMGFKNFWKWRDAHFTSNGYDCFPTLSGNKAISQAIFKDASTLTRKDCGIGNKKIPMKLSGELDDWTKKFYSRCVEKWEIPGKETKTSLAVCSWLHRIVGGWAPGEPQQVTWKHREINRLLESDLKKEQVVIWFAFKNEIASTWNFLDKNGYKCSWIHGDVSVEQRQEKRLRFMRGDTQIMLITEACGMMGFDLSCADTAIYYSAPYSRNQRMQTEDRIEHPMKKDRPLAIIDLITEETIDVDIYEAAKEKNIDAHIFSQLVKSNGRGILA